jgi:hypothetical protein
MSDVISGPKGARRPKTYITGAPILTGMAVKRGADQNTVIPGTVNSANIGIACDDQDTIGRTIQVADEPGESVWVRAGAPFPIDSHLVSDATGRLVAATTNQLSTVIAKRAATTIDQMIPAETIAPIRVLAP